MKPQEFSVQVLASIVAQCGAMQSFDRLVILGYHLLQAAGVPGEVVEFGCYEGHTAAFLTGLTDKTVHVYDSFKGLPDKAPQDITSHWFVTGHLQAAQENPMQACQQHGLRTPHVHPGWFKDLKMEDLPETIALAHIDCDYYISTKEALALVYPNLSPGGVIVIDDYGWPDLQGVKPAVDEFFSDKADKPVYQLGLGGRPTFQAIVKRLEYGEDILRPCSQ